MGVVSSAVTRGLCQLHAKPSRGFRARVAGQLGLRLRARERVAFPAVLGVAAAEAVWTELEGRLGHAVFVAGSLFDLNTVWLGIIVLTLMASVLSWIVQLAEAKIISWKKK